MNAAYDPGSDRSARDAAVFGIVLAGHARGGVSAADRLFRDALAPVALSPMIGFALGWLRRGGIAHAMVCADRPATALRRLVGSGAAVDMRVGFCEDASPRGAAGCARDAAVRIRGARGFADGDTFVVVEGAMIPTVDLADLVDAHWSSDAAATVVVEVDRRRSALTADRPDRPGGVYVFDRRALEAVPAHGFQDIKEGLLGRLYAAGERVITHRVLGISPRVMDLRSYLRVNAWAVERIADAAPSRFRRVGGALCHESARVHPDAALIGPVIVGPDAVIGESAAVVGPCAIGAACEVEPRAVVSRSVLWERCRVERSAFVDAAVLACDARVAEGARAISAVVGADAGVVASHRMPGVAPLWELPHLAGVELRRGLGTRTSSGRGSVVAATTLVEPSPLLLPA